MADDDTHSRIPPTQPRAGVPPYLLVDARNSLQHANPCHGLPLMNWYEHHIGDFAKKCGHLSALEEGIYRRLMDWYYAHEKPLPLLKREVCRCARASTVQERKAVDRVLSEFFELADDGWHKGRIDREIQKYQKGRPASAESKAAQNERKRRSRERRAALFEGLRAHGISPHWNSTNLELLELYEKHAVTVPVTDTGHGMVTRDSTDTGHGAHFPIPNNLGVTVTGHALSLPADGRDGEAATPTATRAGEACKAMRRAGLAATNPSDPRLLALLDAGATVDEFAVIASEAAARSKSWAWVLTVVEGRRREAAQIAQRGRFPAAGATNADRVAEWMQPYSPNAS